MCATPSCGESRNTYQLLEGARQPAARTALEELADAGVLSRKSVAQATTGYIAKDVLDRLI